MVSRAHLRDRQARWQLTLKNRANTWSIAKNNLSLHTTKTTIIYYNHEQTNYHGRTAIGRQFDGGLCPAPVRQARPRPHRREADQRHVLFVAHQCRRVLRHHLQPLPRRRAGQRQAALGLQLHGPRRHYREPIHRQGLTRRQGRRSQQDGLQPQQQLAGGEEAQTHLQRRQDRHLKPV